MNSDQQTMRIATIGAWGHLGRVLGELDRTPDLRVAAMAGMPDEDVERYRGKHLSTGQAEVFYDYRRMLDEFRPRVVVISTRPDRIAAAAIEAAQRGCHLICEKPLSIDHPSLGRLWDACQAGGVRCMAILDNYVHPVVAAASQAVHDGRLGTMAIVNTRKSYKWGNRPAWFGKRDIYGGTIPWVGIHALDFVYCVTGKTFESVAAMHSNVAHPNHAECEDNCAMTLKLSGGGHATASLDLLRPESADTHGDDWFRVVGSAGVLEGHITRDRCVLTAADGFAHDLTLPAKELCFVPFIRSLAYARDDSIDAETRRAFLLTQVSLCARDAADHGALLPIPAAPWT